MELSILTYLNGAISILGGVYMVNTIKQVFGIFVGHEEMQKYCSTAIMGGSITASLILYHAYMLTL